MRYFSSLVPRLSAVALPAALALACSTSKSDRPPIETSDCDQSDQAPSCQPTPVGGGGSTVGGGGAPGGQDMTTDTNPDSGTDANGLALPDAGLGLDDSGFGVNNDP